MLASSIIVGFVLMPFVIHCLGKIAYGFWTLLQSLISYTFLLDFGVRSSLNRHLAKFYAQHEHSKANQVINTGLVVYLVVCAAVIAVSVLLAASFNRFFSFPELSHSTIFWAVTLVGSSVALQFPAAVFSAGLTGMQRYDLMNLAQFLSLLIRTILILLVLKEGHGVLAVSLATFVASLLNLLLEYGFSLKVCPQIRLRFSLADWNTLRMLSTHSIYAFILLAATRVITDTGNIIVGAFFGAAAVTLYGIAGTLTVYATNLISGISTTISPAASELEAKGETEALGALCISGTKFIMLSGMPILLTFILSGKLFIKLWLGEEFLASYPVLVLLSTSWSFNYLQSAAGCVLMGLSRHKIAAWLVMIQAMLCVSLAIFLADRMGMIGVAWGALISSALMNLIFQVHALRLLRIPLTRFLRDALLPVAVSLVPFVVVSKLLFHASPANGLLVYFLQVVFAIAAMGIFLPWTALNRGERRRVQLFFNRWLPLQRSFPT